MQLNLQLWGERLFYGVAFVSPQNSYLEILMPNVMVLGGNLREVLRGRNLHGWD